MIPKHFLIAWGAATALALGTLPATPAFASTPPPATTVAKHAATFSGSGAGQAWDGKLESIRTLASGTISVRFSTKQTKGVGALFSASDRTVDSRNLTLAVSNGHLYWEVRDNTGSTYVSRLDAEDAFVADGQMHTATVAVGARETSIYLDGQQVYSTTGIGFFSSLSHITDVRVGANIDSHGPQWQLSGVVDSVDISDKTLAQRQVSESVSLPAPVLRVTNTTETVSPQVQRVLASGALTVQIKAAATVGKNAVLSTLLRDTTAVAIVSYENDALVVAMGGRKLTLPGTWSAKSRVITLTIAASTVTVYADGTYVGTGVLPAHGLPTVNKVTSSQDTQIFATVLPNATLERLSGYLRPAELPLFDAGYAGSASYRIPSLLHTKAGTLLAGADQRVPDSSDSPNDINFVIRRSTDGGKTWSSINKLIDLPGHSRQAASTIDSVLLQNFQTGTITAVIDVFPGGIGQPNNGPGVGQDADGNLQLFSCSREQYVLQPNGTVTNTQGVKTDWSATQDGTVYKAGKSVGNYYDPLRGKTCSQNSLHLLDTSFMVVTQSHDDGNTWSAPRFINNEVKESWMYFLGTGPGTGIVIDSGAHKGRLLVPVYYSNSHQVYSSAVIYSDDDGKTWHRSKSPNDSRVFAGHKPGSQNLTRRDQSLHEATVVQSGPNELTLFMRNLHAGLNIGVSRSTDGGQTWSAPTFDQDLPNAFSQPNAFSVGPNHRTVVFADAQARLPYRGRGVLHISYDGARTWSKSRTFNPGHYVYQAMAPLPDGSIALLWERERQGLYFSLLPASWLTYSPVATIH